MYCRYCEIYAQSNKRKKEENIQYRHCPIRKTFVHKMEVACDSFKRNKIFWCENDSKWLTFESCVSRQKRKDECSSRCRQKRVINDIMKKEFFREKRRKRLSKGTSLKRRK